MGRRKEDKIMRNLFKTNLLLVIFVVFSSIAFALDYSQYLNKHTKIKVFQYNDAISQEMSEKDYTGKITAIYDNIALMFKLDFPEVINIGKVVLL